MKKSVNEIKHVITMHSESEGVSLVDDRPLYFKEGIIKNKKDTYINVNKNQLLQQIEGLGGAMTETAAYCISILPKDKQKEVFDLYYDNDKGIGYTLLRTSVGSCDYSLSNYSYADEYDPALNDFSIEKDKDYVLPSIKRALTYQPDLKVYSAPWAPPAWMKVNNSRFGNPNGEKVSGSIARGTKNHIKPECYNSYALYFLKYLQAYREEGIEVHSLSIQNETQNNTTWECVYWDPYEQAKFIGSYLGPLLEENGFGHVKILIWDWNRNNSVIKFIPIGLGHGIEKFTKILLKSQAAKYISQIGSHWYSANLFNHFKQPWIEDTSFPILKRIYDRYKERGIDIVQTEACYFGPMDEYYLRPAKHYAYDIINSIRVGCTGFIDWNMLHTVEGTPAHRQGPSHSPIMVDEKTRDYVVHPSYYVIKHLGKYIKEGNKNIDIKTNIPINKVADLTVCSVLNPDTDEVTVLVSNRSDVMKTININDEYGNRNVKVRIKANSVNSYTWSNGR